MELKKIGKYSIVGKVGEGAMGHVYKAHDPVLDRHVAIKMIAHSRDANAEFRERFLREARSAAALNHPNIVTVYDFGEDQGRIYMAMELLEGMDLKDVLRGKPLELEQKLRLMEQICAGLGFAHEKGIVHRDLKPGNIHVKASGQVKIMDFGLARLASSDMTKTGAVMGTPNYMSPEQVQAKPVDARSDVFSLGAVFYELLSNRKPFDADSMHAVMYKVVQCEREPLPEGLPEPVVGLVDKALAKDPAERFQDARELGEAVRAVRRDLDPTRETQVIDPDVMATVVAERKGGPRPSARRKGQVKPKAPFEQGALASGTQRARSRWSRRGLVVGATLVAAVALAAAYGVWRPRAGAPAGEAEEPGAADELAAALVDSQVQLARLNLESKNLRGALKHAENALAAAPGHEEASRIRDEAERALAKLDASLEEARTRLAAGKLQEAARALAAVLAVDPNHPGASEISRELNAYFQTQAEEAQRLLARSRERAAASGASAQRAFRRAEGLAREAQAQMGRGEYAQATQGLLSARDGYDVARRLQQRETVQREANQAAARRDMEEASAEFEALRGESGSPGLEEQSAYREALALSNQGAALGDQGRYKEAAGAYREAAGSLRSAAEATEREQKAREAERRSVAPPTASPPPPPAAAPPRPTSSAPPEAVGSDDEQAIRAVLARWEQAIETKDLDLYRSVRPGLTPDEVKRLQASFKAVKSHDVEIRVVSVSIEGSRATVRLARNDTIQIDGRQQTNGIEQTLVFSKQGAGWVIADIH